MLTINNIVKLKGKVIVLSLGEAWLVVQVGVDHSPVRGDGRYVFKLNSMSMGTGEITFVLYRVFNIKENGYRLYNNKKMDYVTVTNKGLKDIQTFSDILKDELKSCSQ